LFSPSNYYARPLAVIQLAVRDYCLIAGLDKSGRLRNYGPRSFLFRHHYAFLHRLWLSAILMDNEFFSAVPGKWVSAK